MTKQFTRTIENFTCEHCGSAVVGNGYTNHCPKCLYSKHVDIHPGDRKATCGGLMQPIGVENKAGDYVLMQKCVVCGFTKRNKVVKEDDFDKVLLVSSRANSQSK